MVRKIYSTLAVFFIGTTLVLAQTGEMKVKVTDKATKQGIPFAAVVVESGGSQVGSGQTDFDGVADIKPLAPGKYDVKVQVLGYNPLQISGIIVNADHISDVPASMDNGNGVQLKTFTKVEYVVPLIDKGVKSGGTIDASDYNHMASKDLGSVASTVPGIYQQDEGSNISIRGARPSGNADAGEESTTAIYIDGQRVRGSSNIPQSDIEQISVITGGVPAQYGDATGGVINITTKGPESKYFGGVEAVSSQITDAYKYNMFDFSFGGPIITKTDTTTHEKRSILGFIITGQAEHDKDPSPSAVGSYQVNNDVLSQLEANPISPATNGAGFVRNAEYVTANDLTHIDARQNVASTEFILSGKLDYAPSKNITLTLGGSEDYNKYNAFVYEYALFNPTHNPLFTNNTWRVYGRFTQRFADTQSKDAKSASNIKNAYYTIEAGYQNYHSVQEDAADGSNIFNYGYVGKFNQYFSRSYAYQNATSGRPAGYYQNAFSDSLLTFTPGTVNPDGANYTTDFYNFTGAANVTNGAQIQNGLGLLNGDRPSNIYSLWYNTGRQYNGYTVLNNSQFRVVTDFSANIKNNAIQVGFEYEQRTDRYFSVNPIGLWTLMRQLANLHLTQLDTAHPILAGGTGTDPVYEYNRLYDASTQTQFDKSLRQELGLPINGTQWLDIDSYNPSIYSLN
ncbi:MAG TPA: TonB-dependent receptor, partial [Bacteroidia bacterium]|nr:TonB-dependent receptor [Bacteroidia bacterium]